MAATIATAFAAVTAAAVTTGKALVDMTTDGASYADSIIARVYAAELLNVSVNILTGSMTKKHTL